MTEIKNSNNAAGAVAPAATCSPYLYLPVTTPRGIEYAAIPTGMSEEYFDFMVMSLDFHAKHHPTFVTKETPDMGNPITEETAESESPENS